MAISRRSIVLSLAGIAGRGYCLSGAAPELIVAAASDLAPLEAAIRTAYGSGLRFSFASSGALLRQIENGAPFDAYLSANEQYVEEGIRKAVLNAPARHYATGRIAIWSASGRIQRLEQLRDSRVLHVAIANPAYAPYGVAARQALERAGVWKEVRGKIVYGENIRQALQFTESGNADAGILSWTLVKDRGGVLLPESLHAPIRHAGAVVKASRRQRDAERFLDWLTSVGGRAVLAQHGLT